MLYLALVVSRLLGEHAFLRVIGCFLWAEVLGACATSGGIPTKQYYRTI